MPSTILTTRGIRAPTSELGKVNKPKRQAPRVDPGSANHDVSHLIITHQATDMREVCESETSYGWDIV